MAIVLNTIVNPDKLSLINSNFSKLAAAINESLVWRNGSTAGETSFTRDLDMNGYQILNAYVGSHSLDDLVETAYGASDAAAAAAASAVAAALSAQSAEQYASALAGKVPSVVDYPGADNTGATLQDSVFLAAEADWSVIYVPDGTWLLSTPMILGYNKKYYGPGVLKFVNAEWWRRGGSSGSVAINENYTLFYDYTSQSDVTVTFDGVAQPITWVDASTVNAPGSLVTTNVRINIAGGTLKLGTVPEAVRSYNVMANGGSKLASLLPDPLTSPVGMMTTSMGARALNNITTGENTTAFGSRALLTLTTANNNTGIGYQALYRANGDGNTAVGSIAGEWLKSGVYNSLFGASSGGKLTDGIYNTAAGYQALGEAPSAMYTVAIGYRSLGNSGNSSPSYNTSVGAFAGDVAYGLNNSWFGYRAGAGIAPTASDGAENCAFGYQAMQSQNGADFNVAMGVIALRNITSGQYNVALGHGAGNAITTASGTLAAGYKALFSSTASSLTALGYQSQMSNTSGADNTSVGNNTLFTNQTGVGNTAMGESALFSATAGGNTGVGARSLNAQTTATNNSAFGFESGRFTTTASNNAFGGYRAGRALTVGGENTAFGADALLLETTGVQNTGIGRNALRVLQDTTTPVGINNSTGVGYSASVSGSNQVQLGNSATTTYVYGTVQNRSDLRDKADVVDSPLGMNFLNQLRPVQGVWNLRDDYYTVSENEDGTLDSSFDAEGYEAQTKKRSRPHNWFIAQEVKELCDKLGVDFGGLQHQAVNGGCDVYTLGYDEFIPPIVKGLQECWSRMDELEARLKVLEEK